MESYSLQSEAKKRSSGVKALIFEAGIITVLVIVMIFVLNYFRIIRLESFFVQKTVNSSTELAVNKALPTMVSTQQGRLQIAQQSIQRMIKANAFHYSNVITEYEGVLKTLDFHGGKIPNTEKDYKIIMIVNLGATQDAYPTYFPQEAMPRIKVFDKIGDNLIPIALSDLNVGNKLIINYSLSNTMPYPNNLNEAIITRAH